MAKKSSGGGWGIVFLIVIGAIASVPKEVWIVLGILGVIGFIAYAFAKSQSKQSNAPSSRQPVYRTSTPELSVRVSHGGSREKPDSRLSSEQCWMPPGRPFSVSGRTIANGMVYVGSRLPAINSYDIEPAAIDPGLPVSRVGRASQMPYWPSYSEVSREARGEYLEWLETGRRDPDVQIGCVFLFLYGLERRTLHDIRTMGEVVRSELPVIGTEIERLLGIYSSNGSFRGYASALLDVLRLIAATNQKLYEVDPPTETSIGWRRMPMSHKVALGQAALEGVPLSAPWAYSWLMNEEMTWLRKPAERCPEEFKRLFTAMYNQKYGEGMKLPVNKTRLKLTYRPSSSSFRGQLEQDVGDLPDVTVLERPIGALRQLAGEATDALDSYSRFIGRNPEKRNSMDAVVLLPPLLWPRDSLVSLGTWLKQLDFERGMQATSLAELMRHFPAWGEMNRDRAAGFSSALEHFGVGMEPDVRWGAPMPTVAAPVVLFAIPAEERGKKPGSVYSAAALTMHLAVTVSAADGVTAEEEQHLEQSLEQVLHLQTHERLRLRAQLKWLLLSKPSLTAMKKRVAELNASQRGAIAAFVVDVAQYQGGLAPSEMKALTKIYRLLEIPEERLYSMAHAAATEPVAVRTGTEPVRQFAIPKPAAQPATQPLDAARIAKLKEESARVSAVLTTIFNEEEQAAASSDAELSSEPDYPASPVGLDREHSEFVAVLIGREGWTRVELEDLASDRGMLLDGSLERVNEAYMDKYGEPLFEGSDPVVVNQNIIKELQPA
jgi:tellurite resistance protein